MVQFCKSSYDSLFLLYDKFSLDELKHSSFWVPIDYMSLLLYKGREMIEHTKKLVEDKFKMLGGYEHNAEVCHAEFSFQVVYKMLNKALHGMAVDDAA